MDGSPLPEPALIEIHCSGKVRPSGYSDKNGYFNVSLSRQASMIGADASMGGFDEGVVGHPSASGGSGDDSLSGGQTGLDLAGCELRANVPGYRSESVDLTGTKNTQNGDTVLIVVRRIGRIDGLTKSFTSLSAPKDARKALEKAITGNRRGRFDEARANLSKAVEIHPQYAEAWYELGRTYSAMKLPDEAGEAFNKAVAADVRFMPPHLALLELSLLSKDWEVILSASEQVLKLDGFSYPQAWYLNSVAHLQLRHYDDAESSAKETIKADLDKRFPKVRHVLAVAQANKDDFANAANSLRAYLAVRPNGADSVLVKQQLAEFEERVRQPDQPPK
ncbi:MAG: tetratricopeptide repeat protein [Bryobacteraceae bacterium]|nr:tetratricopeptide repeat protein [Bryobacteraceae bacterium]